MAMLEGVAELSLTRLNQISQVWVESDYNQRRHRELGGTISVDGRRFEIPGRYRHLERPTVRYARWDLSAVELIDPHTHTALCALYPLDKQHNASGIRRTFDNADEQPATRTSSDKQKLPPLLEKLMREFSATGLPPGYLADDTGAGSTT